MRINTNVASLTAQENASNVNKNLSASLEKLSSGLRINKAADDASGMAIADKLRTQASSLGQSISNANSAGALVQIADKAMAEQSNILDIVKTKLIQAATETTSDEGRESIRKDVQKLLGQLDNIASQTNYNGINLLNTSGKQFTFQVGEDKDYDISMTTAYAANTSGLGGGAETQDAGTDIDGKSGKVLQVASGNITLSTVTSDGTTAGTAAMDATVNGVVGVVTVGAGADVTLDFSNASTDVKEAIKALGAEMVAATGSISGDTLTIKASQSIDFGNLDFNNVTLKTSAAGATATVAFTTTSAVTVSNNKASGGEMINVAEATTGGDLLTGLTALGANGLTSDIANQYMTAIDSALNQINTLRSDFGSTQNQLDSFVRNAMTTQTNIKAAESVIRDVDYAQESANFNKQNIIAQAGTYAMSQANAVQQNVMRLLQ